ncbi:hypothetical protein, partial [Paramagnetospirillum caucaseum]|uniref:hypothetical protein n=1 Tax=Paramagnetospirillum caucaseum TaxID=1244869 RepID=UPI001F2C9FFC
VIATFRMCVTERFNHIDVPVNVDTHDPHSIKCMEIISTTLECVKQHGSCYPPKVNILFYNLVKPRWKSE